MEYCIASNRPLEKISNIDIYRIIARANSCLEEDEICDVPISYQKNIIYRKIVNLIKRMKR